MSSAAGSKRARVCTTFFAWSVAVCWIDRQLIEEMEWRREIAILG